MDEAIVQRLLTLAQLALDDEEKAQLAADLDSIIGFIEVMNGVPTDGVESLSHAVEMTHQLRSDVTDAEIDREAYQSVAPQTQEGFYLVPKVLEQR